MIGERIREIMKERGVSQNRLAKAAQISQSGLSTIINGQSNPSIATVKAIADALCCSVAELTGEHEEENEKENDILRERLRHDPNYRMLFNAAENAKPEHIRAAAAMLKSLEGEKDD